MGILGLFKKCTCGVCTRETNMNNVSETLDGYICKECSGNIGLGDNFYHKFSCNALGDIMINPVQILKYRLASHISLDPGISLANGETAFYISMGEAGKKRTRTVTIKKGNKTEKHTEDFWDRILCRFYVTDNRIMALAEKNGFEVPLSKLTDLQFNKDSVAIYSGAKTYVVFLVEHQLARLKTLWKLLGLAGEAGISVSADDLYEEINMTKDVEAYKE